MIIFVYGTLRNGLRLHHHLKDSTFTGYASVEGLLYDIGTYPGLLTQPKGYPVFGELYRVNKKTLDHLDLVEEYYPTDPLRSLYIREIIQPTNILLAKGEELGECPVMAYLYNCSVEGLKLISSGDYKNYLSSNSSTDQTLP